MASEISQQAAWQSTWPGATPFVTWQGATTHSLPLRIRVREDKSSRKEPRTWPTLLTHIYKPYLIMVQLFHFISQFLCIKWAKAIYTCASMCVCVRVRVCAYDCVHVYVRVLATPISLPLKTTGCFTVAWLEQTLPTYDLDAKQLPSSRTIKCHHRIGLK